MHYFIYGQHIAAVEDADQAAKYAAAGWRAVSHDQFIDAWKRRDARDLAVLWSEVAPVVMVVKSGKVIEQLPNGWVRYSV